MLPSLILLILAKERSSVENSTSILSGTGEMSSNIPVARNQSSRNIQTVIAPKVSRVTTVHTDDDRNTVELKGLDQVKYPQSTDSVRQ